MENAFDLSWLELWLFKVKTCLSKLRRCQVSVMVLIVALEVVLVLCAGDLCLDRFDYKFERFVTPLVLGRFDNV